VIVCVAPHWESCSVCRWGVPDSICAHLKTVAVGAQLPVLHLNERSLIGVGALTSRPHLVPTGYRGDRQQFANSFIPFDVTCGLISQLHYQAPGNACTSFGSVQVQFRTNSRDIALVSAGQSAPSSLGFGALSQSGSAAVG
jgi:hypothetical protein